LQQVRKATVQTYKTGNYRRWEVTDPLDMTPTRKVSRRVQTSGIHRNFVRGWGVQQIQL